MCGHFGAVCCSSTLVELDHSSRVIINEDFRPVSLWTQERGGQTEGFGASLCASGKDWRGFQQLAMRPTRFPVYQYWGQVSGFKGDATMYLIWGLEFCIEFCCRPYIPVRCWCCHCCCCCCCCSCVFTCSLLQIFLKKICASIADIFLTQGIVSVQYVWQLHSNTNDYISQMSM